jgi:ubiquinone/menaquinone biosynthesis C-methylase UbiE
LFFDLWSLVYDNPFVQGVVYRPVHDAVVQALRARRPRSIADIGCGTGQLTIRLAKELEARIVIGADYSPGMLARAAGRRGAPTWMCADAMALPLADGAVEAVVSTDSFHWDPDQRHALREFARVLVPGGHAYVACIHAATPVVTEVTATWSRAAGQALYLPTRAEMQQMAHEAGFSVRDERILLRLPMTVHLVPILSVLKRP